MKSKPVSVQARLRAGLSMEHKMWVHLALAVAAIFCVLVFSCSCWRAYRTDSSFRAGLNNGMVPPGFQENSPQVGKGFKSYCSGSAGGVCDVSGWLHHLHP